MKLKLFDPREVFLDRWDRLKPSQVLAMLGEVAFDDGDSGWLMVQQIGGPVLTNFRLLGADTPENHKKPGINDYHIETGNIVMEAVQRLVGMSSIEVVVPDYKHRDKYGRLLLDFVVNGDLNVSDRLIESGMAIAYSGRTKERWTTPRLTKARQAAQDLIDRLPPYRPQLDWAMPAIHQLAERMKNSA